VLLRVLFRDLAHGMAPRRTAVLRQA